MTPTERGRRTVGKSIAAVAIVVALLVGFGVGYIATPLITPPSAPVGKKPLTGTVSIGSILPLTGDLASYGENSKVAVELAETDFNQYLQKVGATWKLDVVIEDTGTDPVIALNKLQELNAKGIKLIVGPQTSGEIRNIKGYADSNNILLVSQSSTAPELAVAGDSVYRFVTDDNSQGPAVARALRNDGIDVVVPVWRGDAWGDGLNKASADSFAKLGGKVDDGIRYSPDVKEFSADTSVLAEKVKGYVDQSGAEKVGVLYMGFAEAIQFFQAASAHDVLGRVRWYGSDGTAQLAEMTADPIASGFAEKVGFLNPIFAASKTSKNLRVVEHVRTQLGRTPDTYAVSAYDIVWVLGLAIHQTGTTDVSTIKSVVPDVVNSYFGALGWIRLNAAGDLATADYELWQIVSGQWEQTATYVSSTDAIVKG